MTAARLCSIEEGAARLRQLQKADNGDDVTYGYYVVGAAVPDYGTSYIIVTVQKFRRKGCSEFHQGTITIKNTESMRFYYLRLAVGEPYCISQGDTRAHIGRGDYHWRSRVKNDTKYKKPRNNCFMWLLSFVDC